MFCRIYGIFHRMLDHLSRLEATALCLLFSAMVVLAGLQIFLRIFFNSGLFWADSLLRYLVLWVGMLGAVVATERNKHIAIDLASNLFQAELKPWLGAVIHAFSFSVCSVLTYVSVIFVVNESRFPSLIILGMSSWILNLIFPIAFAMISLRFFSAAVDDILVLSGKSCPYF